MQVHVILAALQPRRPVIVCHDRNQTRLDLSRGLHQWRRGIGSMLIKIGGISQNHVVRLLLHGEALHEAGGKMSAG